MIGRSSSSSATISAMDIPRTSFTGPPTNCPVSIGAGVLDRLWRPFQGGMTPSTTRALNCAIRANVTKRLSAIALTGVLLVGGALNLATTRHASAAVTKAKTTHKPKPKTKKVIPGVGSTITVLNENKQTETVTLTQVIDPAQGADQFTTPDAGKRFVGVVIQISNKSKGTDSNDANNNLAVVGSNKEVYSADFNMISECTDFNDGQYAIPDGSSEVGCVTFQVPNGITVAKVQYNPDSGFSTNEAVWTLVPPQ